MRINIGIKDQDRERLAEELSKLLADSYTLYLKTHNFHWNVTGPMFQTLHLMFEQQYTELALAVDTRRTYPRARTSCDRELQCVFTAGYGCGHRRGSQGERHGQASRGRSGGGGAYRPQGDHGR